MKIDNPASCWYKQIERVLLLNQVVLEAGHGLTVVLKVFPGGRIEQAQYTVKLRAE